MDALGCFEIYKPFPAAPELTLPFLQMGTWFTDGYPKPLAHSLNHHEEQGFDGSSEIDDYLDHARMFGRGGFIGHLGCNLCRVPVDRLREIILDAQFAS